MSPRSKSQAAKNVAKPARGRRASKPEGSASGSQSKSPGPRGNPSGPKLKPWENGIELLNSGKKWTEKQIALLVTAHRAGMSYKDIQRQLLRSNVSMRLKVFHWHKANGLQVPKSLEDDGEDDAALAAAPAASPVGAESRADTPVTVAAAAPAAVKRDISGLDLICEAIEMGSLAETTEKAAVAEQVEKSDLSERKGEEVVKEAKPFATWPANLGRCSIAHLISEDK